MPVSVYDLDSLERHVWRVEDAWAAALQADSVAQPQQRMVAEAVEAKVVDLFSSLLEGPAKAPPPWAEDITTELRIEIARDTLRSVDRGPSKPAAKPAVKSAVKSAAKPAVKSDHVDLSDPAALNDALHSRKRGGAERAGPRNATNMDDPQWLDKALKS